MSWITNSVKKILIIWSVLCTVVVVMVLISESVYRIWVGNEIKVPFLLSVFMGLFVIITNWSNIFSYFLNGIGKIRLQFYSSIIIAIVNIPLSVLLAKYFEMGITGVILATSICVGAGAIWAPIQYYKIIKKTAKGIWLD
jgi:Na+-driven multidrug efflux pump